MTKKEKLAVGLFAILLALYTVGLLLLIPGWYVP